MAAKNNYADLHCHISLKQYVNNKRSLWHHKAYDNNRNKGPRSGAESYSQSDVTSLVDGRVDLAVVALHPLENLIDNSGFLAKYLANSIFFQFKLGHLKRLRKAYDTKFKLLNYELNFVKRGPVQNGRRRFHLVENKHDLNKEGTKVILSIEGGHSLQGEGKSLQLMHQELPVNLEKIKKSLPPWNLPVFMLTLCHFEFNQLAGQAWALPLPGVAKPILKKARELIKVPKGREGITPLGKKIVNQALDNNHGRRILIDLKHCSVQARQDYYQLVRTQHESENIPIIFSHAAVSGINTFEQQLNDVDNQKANIAKHFEKFNPWAINLCDDDIREIAELGGLIGITLDERILGSKNASHIKHIRKNLRRAGIATNKWNVHAMLFLENVFHVVAVGDRNEMWSIICISSDFDGIIDPIESCPTAKHLDKFERLLVRIGWQYYQRCDYYKRVFLTGASDFKKKIRKVMFENQRDFIFENFPE